MGIARLNSSYDSHDLNDLNVLNGLNYVFDY